MFWNDYHSKILIQTSWSLVTVKWNCTRAPRKNSSCCVETIPDASVLNYPRPRQRLLVMSSVSTSNSSCISWIATYVCTSPVYSERCILHIWQRSSIWERFCLCSRWHQFRMGIWGFRPSSRSNVSHRHAWCFQHWWDLLWGIRLRDNHVMTAVYEA